MSDTGESETSVSGSSCSWAVVDQMGNLQDDDSLSSTSSVEVVEEEGENDHSHPDNTTPISGNSPPGQFTQPKFILRLPSRQHEASDSDEEPCSSLATDSIKESQSVDKLPPPTMLSAGSLATDSIKESQSVDKLSPPTTPSAGSLITQEALPCDQEPILSISQEAKSMISGVHASPPNSPSQSVSKEHIDSLVKAIDDVQHNLAQTRSGSSPSLLQSQNGSSPSSPQSHNCSSQSSLQFHSEPSSFSSMELFGNGNRDEARTSTVLPQIIPGASSQTLKPTMSVETIGVRSNPEDIGTDSMQSSVSSAFSFLSRHEGDYTSSGIRGDSSCSTSQNEGNQLGNGSCNTSLIEGNQHGDGSQNEENQPVKENLEEIIENGSLDVKPDNQSVEIMKENQPEILTPETAETSTVEDEPCGQGSASTQKDKPCSAFFTTCRSYLCTDQLRNVAMMLIVALYVFMVGMIVHHMHMWHNAHCVLENQKTELRKQELMLWECKQSLNDANQANQDLVTQIGKLRYSNPNPSLPEETWDQGQGENAEQIEKDQVAVEEGTESRDKLDRARWDIYSKRLSEWNLVHLQEEANQDLKIAEAEYEILRDAKEELEVKLVNMAEEITDVKNVIKKLEATKIQLELQVTRAKESIQEMKEKENLQSSHQSDKRNVESQANTQEESASLDIGENSDGKKNKEGTGDDTEDIRKCSQQAADDTDAGADDTDTDADDVNYKACWRMMEAMYQKQFEQMFDFSWKDVKSYLLDDYLRSYLPQDMFEFLLKMNVNNSENHSEESKKENEPDKEPGNKKDATNKQSPNEKENQSSESQKSGPQNEENQSEKAEGSFLFWSDTVMNLMNKTKSQIQDTWEQVKNVSDNLWNKHEPALNKIQTTLTRKLQHLSEKFQQKLAKKARKWFQKSRKSEKKSEKEKKVEERSSQNAKAKRRRDADKNHNPNQNLKDTNQNMKDTNQNMKDTADSVVIQPVSENKQKISCNHQLLVLESFIWHFGYYNKHKESDDEDLYPNQVRDNLLYLENDESVNSDDHQRRWVECQELWWRYDITSVIGDGCLSYLLCWQVEMVGKEKCDRQNEYVLTNYCTLDDAHREPQFKMDEQDYVLDFSKHKTLNHVQISRSKGKEDVDVDDDDGDNSNWYFVRAEDREFYHNEPDDWYFRRSKKDNYVNTNEKPEERARKDSKLDDDDDLSDWYLIRAKEREMYHDSAGHSTEPYEEFFDYE